MAWYPPETNGVLQYQRSQTPRHIWHTSFDIPSTSGIARLCSSHGQHTHAHRLENEFNTKRLVHSSLDSVS